MALAILRAPGAPPAHPAAGAVVMTPETPTPISVPTVPPHIRTPQQAVRFAYEVAHGLGYRVDIAVADLASGKTWRAGDSGTFGTASVVKTMVATAMLLSGAMHGPDADEAYRMITRSDDEACTDLWTRFGAEQIIGSLGAHYQRHFGEPNKRVEYWGNTQVTASSLVSFYRAVAHDPAVAPWLFDAMAHTTRIAADGTHQYFGIPAAGGGHTVKQGWGTASAGDGFGDNATVNSTGIVTIGKHRYAVAILTEGRHNVPNTDDHGYDHIQGQLVTSIARIVLDALRGTPGASHASGQ